MKLKNGTYPTPADHRDFDYVKTFGAPVAPTFPSEYATDAGLWCPNQNEPNLTFNFPAEPNGCTNYTQADLAADEHGKLYNPFELEGITRANARGGYNIRDSLEAARKELGWITAYFNIKAYAPLDYFDAIRLAIFSGAPEKRSVSWGTPWWPNFETVGSDGILTAPNSFSTTGASWHNHKVCGWKSINGQTYLISKSWQGVHYGDKGYVYFSRALVNSIMSIQGTVAFTATSVKPDNVQTIDLNFIIWMWSYMKGLLGFRY